MTTGTKDLTCKIRIDWRYDGQLGYRYTDLAEIRSDWAGRELSMCTSLMACFSDGREVVHAEGRTTYCIGLGGAHRELWIGGDVADFVAIIDGMLAGKSFEQIHTEA